MLDGRKSIWCSNSQLARSGGAGKGFLLWKSLDDTLAKTKAQTGALNASP